MKELSTYLAGILPLSFKFKNGKTYSDFTSFWDARQAQKKFDHLLKLDFHEGVLEVQMFSFSSVVEKSTSSTLL